MELCENCGHENHEEPVVCKKCGSVLGNLSRKAREAERDRMKELFDLM